MSSPLGLKAMDSPERSTQALFSSQLRSAFTFFPWARHSSLCSNCMSDNPQAQKSKKVPSEEPPLSFKQPSGTPPPAEPVHINPSSSTSSSLLPTQDLSDLLLPPSPLIEQRELSSPPSPASATAGPSTPVVEPEVSSQTPLDNSEGHRVGEKRSRRGKRRELRAGTYQQAVMVRSPSSGSDNDSDFSYPYLDDTQSPTSPGSREGGRKRTRQLTTEHQSEVLHELLAQSKFPSTQVREEVGRRIGMSARKVQIWFQNQRQKIKREQSEGQTVAPQPQPYIGYPGAATQIPYPGPINTSAAPSPPGTRRGTGTESHYHVASPTSSSSSPGNMSMYTPGAPYPPHASIPRASVEPSSRRGPLLPPLTTQSPPPHSYIDRGRSPPPVRPMSTFPAIGYPNRPHPHSRTRSGSSSIPPATPIEPQPIWANPILPATVESTSPISPLSGRPPRFGQHLRSPVSQSPSPPDDVHRSYRRERRKDPRSDNE